MKVCRDCKIEKENSEFSKRKSNLDGLYSYCKECTSRKNKETHLKYRDERLEKSREYKKKNTEILRVKSLKYYYDNREKILEKCEVYRNKNKKKISLNEAERRLKDQDRFEKNRKRHLEWSKNNRERLNEYQKDWYQKNKEKRRAHVILRRAILSGNLMRPESCSECYKKCKPDGHHHDYSKPLDVIWICRACHSRKSPRTVIGGNYQLCI